MNRWLFPLVAALIGVAIGIGGFTFVYARGYSYLADDPSACANCHIMDDHYAAWLKSSHRNVATCNSCHTPHDIVGKYATKARNGFWHGFYFTTGNFPYPLRITERNHEVTEQTCRDCHASIAATVDHAGAALAPGVHQVVAADRDEPPPSCTRCHQYVGHWVR